MTRIMKTRPRAPFDPDDPRLDPEVKHLCTAMNRLPGILTTESCCGHGKQPFWIWFIVTDPAARGFVTIARLLCTRYYGWGNWRALLDHGDIPDSQVSFLLEGPVGQAAYDEADAIAKEIDAHVDRTTEGYNILFDEKDPPRAENLGDEKAAQFQRVLDAFPTKVSLSYARHTPAPEPSPSKRAVGLPSLDDPPPAEVLVCLQFSEKSFGFGEVTLKQTPDGLFLDTEHMSLARVKRYLAALVEDAITDTDQDPKRHALYNEVMGRSCGSGCQVCYPKAGPS